MLKAVVTSCNQSGNNHINAFLNYCSPFLILKFLKQLELIESVIKALVLVITFQSDEVCSTLGRENTNLQLGQILVMNVCDNSV
jgi:hypothetical protein